MPKKTTVIRWQRKQAREPGSYTTVPLDHRKPEGVKEITNWLELTSPSHILDDLREYQNDWCPHIYEIVATVRRNGKVKTFYCCKSCSHVHTDEKTAN